MIRSLQHHVSKRCSEKKKLSVLDLATLEVLEQSRVVVEERRVNCQGLSVCRAVRHLSYRYLKDSINLHLLEAGLSPFISRIDCQDLFPQC